MRVPNERTRLMIDMAQTRHFMDMLEGANLLEGLKRGLLMASLEREAEARLTLIRMERGSLSQSH